jgi:two-component system sensor histidine kinase DesK
VIRHSGAKNCRIRLTEHPGELSLEIFDDGRGLGQPQPDQRPDQQPDQQPDPQSAKGTGLRGMSERLSAAGGRLSLAAADPARGQGFKLTATVPVDRYDA